MTNLPIRITGNGMGHKLEIDGHDVSNYALGANLDINPSEGTTLLLRLIVSDSVETKAVVLLSDEVAEVLVAMGWTPPDKEIV